MCIAVPVKVVSIQGDTAWCSPGAEGTRVEASLVLLEEDVQPGDYVLLHAGAAICRLEPEEAEENLRLMQEVVQAEEQFQQEQPDEKSS